MDSNRRTLRLKSLEKLNNEVRERLGLGPDESCHYTVDISHTTNTTFIELEELRQKLIANLAHIKRITRPTIHTSFEA